MSWRLTAIEAAALVLAFSVYACGPGDSSSGAGSEHRVPLTDADREAIELAGGLHGQWLAGTASIIRVDAPPPPHAESATAHCPDFKIYHTTRDSSPASLAGLFVHEGQHIHDGCRDGPVWECRAIQATRCWRAGVPRSRCNFPQPVTQRGETLRDQCLGGPRPKTHPHPVIPVDRPPIAGPG